MKLSIGHDPAGRRQPSPAAGTPLRARLFLLTAAAIAPLAVMAGIGLLALQRQQTAQAQRIGVELSRSVANAVDAELRSAIATLETLATSPTLDLDDVQDFRQGAERVRELRPEWSAVVLSAPDGRPILDARGGEGADPPPLIERDSFDRAVQLQRAVVGSLTRGRAAEWYFPIRVPVIRDGTVRFVVSALVKPDAIRNVLTRQQLPADWVISIVDGNGLRVARSRAHEESLGGRLSETAQRLVDAGGQDGFGISYTLEGERIFTPFSRLANGWIAVLGLPTAIEDAAARRALSTYGGGLLLSIALGSLGALWVARTITRPIAELRSAAHALGAARASAVPDSAIQEIRDVATALNGAAVELAKAAADRDELLRKERRAREAAEAADRAKDEFLAVLSHELRTPLNAVFGWAKMLQAGQLRDEAADRAKNAIVRNADVQMQLIDDLLDLSRITNGKLRLDRRPVDLEQVLQAAADAVRPAADAKSIRFKTVIERDLGSISGDPGRIQQIVWNLLTNAVKFTPPAGEVQLRAQRLTSTVQIVVSDTGEGIAPEMVPHVFERFRQGDSSSTRRHGGLGLGLALVKHLVELHGGAVRAESAGLDRGAVFTVTLPATTPAPTPDKATVRTEHEHSTVTRLDGMRALVVDDDAEGLALTETILRRAGAEVRTCANAGTALDLISAWRPDVLVSDIEMPGEDGYALIRKMRALPVDAGGATPAVALTAYGRTQDRERALSEGFNMHVPKPVDPGELTTIVAAIAGPPQFSPLQQS